MCVCAFSTVLSNPWELELLLLVLTRVFLYMQARKAYLKYMVDTVVALGGHKTTAIEQMNETMEFEIELQKVRHG